MWPGSSATLGYLAPGLQAGACGGDGAVAVHAASAGAEVDGYAVGVPVGWLDDVLEDQHVGAGAPVVVRPAPGAASFVSDPEADAGASGHVHGLVVERRDLNGVAGPVGVLAHDLSVLAVGYDVGCLVRGWAGEYLDHVGSHVDAVVRRVGLGSLFLLEGDQGLVASVLGFDAGHGAVGLTADHAAEVLVYGDPPGLGVSPLQGVVVDRAPVGCEAGVVAGVPFVGVAVLVRELQGHGVSVGDVDGPVQVKAHADGLAQLEVGAVFGLAPEPDGSDAEGIVVLEGDRAVVRVLVGAAAAAYG